MNEKTTTKKPHASLIKYQPFQFTVCMYVNVFHFVTDVLHSEHSFMTFLNLARTKHDKAQMMEADGIQLLKFITGSGGCTTKEGTKEVTRSLSNVAI